MTTPDWEPDLRPCRWCNTIYDANSTYVATKATRPRTYCSMTCRTAQAHRLERDRRRWEQAHRTILHNRHLETTGQQTVPGTPNPPTPPAAP